MAPWLLLPWILLFRTHFDLATTVGSEIVAAVCSGFLRAILVSWRKLQRSPFEHWPFFFPLVTSTFSTFNATHSLSIPDHCSRFNSPVPGVEVSQSTFQICTPLHYCFQFLKIGHRYLLMNLHVVQFQCRFELRGTHVFSILFIPRYHRMDFGH